FRDAEGACASQQAHLASAEELHHAVVECFFSPCTRGWLYGGTVGTTVCNVVGSALKAVDVRTENTIEDTAHLDAFCIKDKGVPCGDPPSFPNARLQGHTGYDMGDELLYTCVTGYAMPSGHSAFSLLCDSCGEWYGLVEICVKDETESPVDYEDKFTDSYVEAEHEDRAVEDFIGHPRWEQERRVVVKNDAATEAPVSLLSQKHLFWFPSEAFQEEGHPVSTNPVTQTTQRASGAQSEESKDYEEHDDVTGDRAEGGVATDDTWLDGYPVVPEETEIADSTTESVRPEDTDRGAVVRATDKPNEVEIRGPGPHTTLAEVGGSPTTMPALNQGGAEELWPGFIPNAAPSQPSDSPSYSDTLDYDTQQAAPTHFWQGDLTEHPLLDHSPVPPMHDGNDVVMEEHTVYILPGETGERGEMEGEIGEAICTGDNCPLHPPSSSSRGPTVAAIIVALCAIATAVIVGVWCYRRQQQKNSVYEMNGKGQSQTRQGQQIEMQQKV
uniref:Sushi domain containing 5 n=1 Tax=Cyclopterus lumpus TaxID=8103 RepID=A0A8C2WMA1_CYCLU